MPGLHSHRRRISTDTIPAENSVKGLNGSIHTVTQSTATFDMKDSRGAAPPHSSFHDWVILLLGCFLSFSICLAPVVRHIQKPSERNSSMPPPVVNASFTAKGNRLKPISTLFTANPTKHHKYQRSPVPVTPLNYVFFGILIWAGLLTVVSLIYMLFFEEDSLVWFDENLQERCLLHTGSGEPPPLRSLISGEYDNAESPHSSVIGQQDEVNRRDELLLMASTAYKRRRKTLTEKDFLHTLKLSGINERLDSESAPNLLHVVKGLPKLATISSTLLPPHRYPPTAISNVSEKQHRRVQ